MNSAPLRRGNLKDEHGQYVTVPPIAPQQKPLPQIAMEKVVEQPMARVPSTPPTNSATPLPTLSLLDREEELKARMADFFNSLWQQRQPGLAQIAMSPPRHPIEAPPSPSPPKVNQLNIESDGESMDRENANEESTTEYSDSPIQTEREYHAKILELQRQLKALEEAGRPQRAEAPSRLSIGSQPGSSGTNRQTRNTAKPLTQAGVRPSKQSKGTKRKLAATFLPQQGTHQPREPIT